MRLPFAGFSPCCWFLLALGLVVFRFNVLVAPGGMRIGGFIPGVCGSTSSWSGRWARGSRSRGVGRYQPGVFPAVRLFVGAEGRAASFLVACLLSSCLVGLSPPLSLLCSRFVVSALLGRRCFPLGLVFLLLSLVSSSSSDGRRARQVNMPCSGGVP